ncbi:MAG: hypothetical protein CMO77_02905 [Verrucomicrobiales bacterium]|nr:hypothetical protein [Verrucomicrobiales bacterium]
MRLESPWWLLLLIIFPLIGWVKYRWFGGQPSLMFSSVQLLRGITALSKPKSGFVLGVLRWVALVLFVVAMARPQWGEGVEKIKASGIDIAVAFDLSGSMLAEDFQLKGERVNRATVAKEVLKGFVEDRPADRIGLVAFAGRAYIAAPLTLDHDFLMANLNRLEAGSASIEDGTAIGSAISAGLNRLRDLDSESRIIILMTDGQNNSGTVNPLTAAEAAELLGVKVYTIGVGTIGMAPMPYTDVFNRKRYRNVEVNIDEDTLKKIADLTGGKYFRADSSRKLRQIYNDIDKLEKTEIEVERYFNYDELFHYFILAGLAFLLLELILANSVWLKLP